MHQHAEESFEMSDKPTIPNSEVAQLPALLPELFQGQNTNPDEAQSNHVSNQNNLPKDATNLNHREDMSYPEFVKYVEKH